MTIYWPDYIESSCRQNYTYFDSGDFLQTAYHLTAFFTIPLSLFTVFTIIRKTPEKMKNMRIPLLIAQFWSTNLDMCLTVYASPMTFFPTASAVFMGLFATIGVPSKWLAYIGQVSVTMMSVNFVMLLENRHSQIAMISLQISRKITRIVYFAVNYIMAFVVMLPFYLENSDQLELRKLILKRIPCPTIDFYDKNAIVLLKGGEISAYFSVGIGLAMILAQTLFFSIHAVYHLNFKKHAMVSECTKALQRKFLGYVVLQVTIPWTVLAGPILYSLYADKNEYYNQAFNNFAMLFMASHGFLSTLSTLFVIKPYRDFIRSILKGHRNFDANSMWASNVKSIVELTNVGEFDRRKSVNIGKV